MTPRPRCRLLLPVICWVALSGCATLTESPTQMLEIVALDQRDRAVTGMECKLSNEAGDYVATTPSRQVEVQRSSTPLEIECQRGGLFAKGTVIPKGDSSMVHSFLPGGSIATLIDHASGAMYTYPSPLTLRLGQHLQFEHGGGARSSLVAKVASDLESEPGARVTSAISPTPPAAAQAKGNGTPASTSPAPNSAPRLTKPQTARAPVPPSGMSADVASSVSAEPKRNAPLTW